MIETKQLNTLLNFPLFNWLFCQSQFWPNLAEYNFCAAFTEPAGGSYQFFSRNLPSAVVQAKSCRFPISGIKQTTESSLWVLAERFIISSEEYFKKKKNVRLPYHLHLCISYASLNVALRFFAMDQSYPWLTLPCSSKYDSLCTNPLLLVTRVSYYSYFCLGLPLP